MIFELPSFAALSAATGQSKLESPTIMTILGKSPAVQHEAEADLTSLCPLQPGPAHAADTPNPLATTNANAMIQIRFIRCSLS
jgi:hypothetical protein